MNKPNNIAAIHLSNYKELYYVNCALIYFTIIVARDRLIFRDLGKETRLFADAFFCIDLQIALRHRCAHEESDPPCYFPCRASLKRRRVTLAANESIFRFRSLSVLPRPRAECIHGRY